MHRHLVSNQTLQNHIKKVTNERLPSQYQSPEINLNTNRIGHVNARNGSIPTLAPTGGLPAAADVSR